MSWVVTAIVGTAAVGAITAKKSADAQVEGANKAADTSLAVTNANIAAQQEALDKILAANKDTLASQTALNKPWQDAGTAALEYITRGTAEGWLQPLGSSTAQKPYAPPTKEEIIASAGGENPEQVLAAMKKNGYSAAEVDQAFGLQPGEANAWIQQNTGSGAGADREEILNLTGGSEDPATVYRTAKQYGYSDQQLDEAFGLQPGEAKQWIDQNGGQIDAVDNALMALSRSGGDGTLKPFEFKPFNYEAPANLQPGEFTDRGDFNFSKGEFEYDDYTRPEFNFEADPGYQFRLDQGQLALNRQASVRGRLASPATDKGVARYSQGLAAQEYANAFNRYLQTTDRDNNRKKKR